MNSRERVFAVLSHKIPDRVPIFNFWMDENVLKRINPTICWPDFCVEMDLDIIVVDMDHDIEVIDQEKNIFKNEWGVVRKKTTERTTVPIDGPIKSSRDLASYNPPDPTDLSRLKTLQETISVYKDKKIICLHIHDAFNIPWYLRGGIQRLLLDYYENPQLAKDLAKISTEYYCEIVRQAVRLGADMFIIGDDYAFKTAPFMSPKQFEEFVLPGLATIVSEIKRKNSYCIKHSDGNLIPILDMIVSTGIDALHPIEPEAGMDILKIKETYGDKICVCGNVDVGSVLSEGTPSLVEAHVKELIARVSPGGRHILSDSNSILSSVKPENYLAMIQAAKRYGIYPITIQ